MYLSKIEFEDESLTLWIYTSGSEKLGELISSIEAILVKLSDDE